MFFLHAAMTVLIWRFVIICWVFVNAWQIFTEDMDEVKSLPRESVLNFIEKVDETLVVPYLVSSVDRHLSVSFVFVCCLFEKWPTNLVPLWSFFNLAARTQADWQLSGDKPVQPTSRKPTACIVYLLQHVVAASHHHYCHVVREDCCGTLCPFSVTFIYRPDSVTPRMFATVFMNVNKYICNSSPCSHSKSIICQDSFCQN